MHPLRFEPLFQRYLWGGQRLGSVLNKPTGDQTAAESWEVVDHGDDQSVVAHGPLAGQTLRELMLKQGEQLIGTKLLEKTSMPSIPPNLKGRFPLLLKFLDANSNLSLQVHPDDEMGATLSPPDLGKTEAWYVMHADPGAKIYAGLKPGVTREQFQAAVENGTTDSLIHSFEPTAGQCVMIYAGTMHAIGAGLLIAEIQQASNTTFRLHDWNRVDAEGNSRPLHIEQGIQATNFGLDTITAEQPKPTSDPRCEKIVECDKFVVNRWQSNNSITFQQREPSSFRILAVIRGSVSVSDDPCESPLSKGQTMLLPAMLEETTVNPIDEAEFLEIYVP